MDTQTFSTWFQRTLKRRRWSQADFHRESNVPRSTVSAWYRGVRVPDPPMCEVVADAFGISVDAVLELAGHRPQVEELAPDDPKRELIATVDRLAPTKVQTALRLLRALDDSRAGWT